LESGVAKVDIPDLSRSQAASANVPLAEFEPSALTVRAAELLERYFQGERIEFNDIPVVLNSLTPFRQRVLLATRDLLYGQVCSYGQLAAACGSPHAARAIGGALAANPVPIIIPCHRVTGSNGCLTGYSAPGGEETKRVLLIMEGVKFNGVQVVTNQLVMHRVSGR
jgi:methylated-DNA-[protein]-cysteine S-methyltransferase